jgi:hypothetical protein
MEVQIDGDLINALSKMDSCQARLKTAVNDIRVIRQNPSVERSLALKDRHQCPRCRGLVVQDRDGYGSYEHCLYCGYLRDLPVHLAKANPRSTRNSLNPVGRGVGSR